MQGRRAGSNSESPQRLHAWGDLVSIRPNFDLDSKYWCATVARIVGDNLRGAPMNVMDRAFLYVGVLAIAVLAVTAIFQTFHPAKTFHAAEQVEALKLSAGKAEQIEALKPVAGKGTAPAAEVLVGALDLTKTCYVSELPDLYSVPDSTVPRSIVWTPIGSNHAYTITFADPTPLEKDTVVQVPRGQPSNPEYISTTAKPGQYKYTVMYDGTLCTTYIYGSPTGTGTVTSANPVWVHVSK